VLLGVFTVLVVALVVLASVATAQRRRESRLAASRQLSVQARALADEHLDLALLLSQEAYRLSPTPEARGSLIASLQRDPRLVTFLNGHTDRAGPAVFSPDGTLVAAGGDDGTLLLWDAGTGRPAGAPLEVGDDVRTVAFSPDGAILASGAHHADRTVTLWDAKSRSRIGSLAGHTDDVRGIAFSPDDGNRLASAGADGTIRIWDVRAGQTVVTLEQGAAVNALAFLPDGSGVVAGSDSGQILVWDIESRTSRAVPAPATHDVRALAVRADGTLLATGGTDNDVRLWDLATGQPGGEPLAGHEERIFTLAFSPDGRILASGSRDGDVLLWDVASGRAAGEPLGGHSDSIRSVAFSPDGRFVVTASDDHRVALWELDGRLNLATALGRHGDWVGGVAISPDGQALQTGGAATSVAFSSDGRLLAAGTLDGTVVAWDLATRQERFRTTRAGAVLGLTFRPETAVVAVVGGDADVQLLDVIAGTETRLPTESDQLVSVAASADGRRLAAGGLDGRLWVWDLRRGPKRVLLSCSAERPRLLCGRAINTLAFSFDGEVLASGSADKSVSLWDPAERQTGGEPIRQMTGHQDEVLSVAFSRRGRALASAGADGRVILWGTGMPVGDPFVGHDGPVNSLVFAPDGERLYSAGDDRNVLSWDVDFDSWRARACRTANRNLDAAERRLYLGSSSGSEPTCPGLP
ncbi:MAG: WD40 repeat domain-containing protein, partial [Actinomycetota bacterium]|nr:WD40 repeat domain-containing protein [Actinomycetota bacterium]